MSDLAKRLRVLPSKTALGGPIIDIAKIDRERNEAADEIERLTAALAAAEVTAWNAAIEAADNALCALWKETP